MKKTWSRFTGWWKRFLPWLVLRIFGFALGVFFLLLLLLRRVEIKNWHRFPKWQRGLVVLSNHPSLLEIVLDPALFAWQYLWQPNRHAPWNTPDEKNFRERWPWWGWICSDRFIWIPRGKKIASARAQKQIIKVIRAGYHVILFPEGGRTGSSKEHLVSNHGHRMRPFLNGAGYTAIETGAPVLLVWVSGTDVVLRHGEWWPRFWRQKIIINIGNPRRYRREGDKRSRRAKAPEITRELEQALLTLADEVNP